MLHGFRHSHTLQLHSTPHFTTTHWQRCSIELTCDIEMLPRHPVLLVAHCLYHRMRYAAAVIDACGWKAIAQWQIANRLLAALKTKKTKQAKESMGKNNKKLWTWNQKRLEIPHSTKGESLHICEIAKTRQIIACDLPINDIVCLGECARLGAGVIKIRICVFLEGCWAMRHMNCLCWCFFFYFVEARIQKASKVP